MKTTKNDVKKNFADEIAKQQTAWEKAKVTQEELDDFLKKNVKKDLKEGDWKGLKKKLKDFIKEEYKKDRRLRSLSQVKNIQNDLLYSGRKLKLEITNAHKDTDANKQKESSSYVSNIYNYL